MSVFPIASKSVDFIKQKEKEEEISKRAFEHKKESLEEVNSFLKDKIAEKNEIIKEEVKEENDNDPPPLNEVENNDFKDWEEVAVEEVLNDFEKKLTKQPFLNAFIKRVVEQGDDLMFNDLVSSKHRAILEYFDMTTGDTLLHIASKNNRVNIIKQIVVLINSHSHTIYVVKPNILGFTPLINAIENNNAECVLFLLTCGINNLVAAQTKIDGKTSLHYLAESRINGFYKQLIFNLMHLSNEQVNLKTSDGDTAFDIAMFNENNRELIQVLLNRGAIHSRKYLSNIHSADLNDYSIERVYYRTEIATTDSTKKDIYEKLYKKYGEDDIDFILLKLKAFIKDLGKTSPIDDWKKLFQLKVEIDSSNLFGKNTMETPQQKLFLEKCLILLEKEDFKNHLITLARVKKLGGKLKEEIEYSSVNDEDLLKRLYEMKEECIERFERISSVDVAIRKILNKLNVIVF